MNNLVGAVILKPSSLQKICRCVLQPVAINCFRGLSSKPKNEKETEPDYLEGKPVKYLQSPASQWKAQYSTAGMKDDAPWMERWSVLASISIFLLYFCVFREENDIDERLRQPLFDTVPGLEEQHLIALHKFNTENRLSNKDIEIRMKELGMNIETIKNSY